MTSSEGGFIPKNAIATFQVDDTVDIYVIATAATVAYHVTEGA